MRTRGTKRHAAPLMSAFLTAALLGAAGPARGQVHPESAGSDHQTQTQSPMPAPRANSNNRRGSLSHQLSHSQGVIEPPDTGDRNVRLPPNAGSTPEIPPPGTPHGRQNVQPK